MYGRGLLENPRHSMPLGRLPTFFLLGAGRCGTTSLAEVLRTHPQVFVSEPKEPTFFCAPFQLVRDPLQYVSLFDGAGDARAVGEASHAYLSHPGAARALRAFFPDARFVVIFRNPADRALALYHFMLQHGYERILPFERALAAEDRRFHSAHFANRCPQYFWNFMYVRSGLFGQQIQRYLQFYPRERFFITTLPQLLSDPGGVVGNIHEFLGVERRPTVEFPRFNASRTVRSPTLARMSRFLLGPRTGRLGLAVGRGIRQLNVVPGVAPRIREETRVELNRRFREDLTLLADLTGVDVLAAERDQ